MRKKTYTREVRERAQAMYSAHYTYAQIGAALNIPKSTLSTWLGERSEIRFGSEQWRGHLATIRTAATHARKRAREEKETSAVVAAVGLVTSLPFHSRAFILSLLGMLYWSEGARHEGAVGVRFTNTDPKMISLFMDLYRRIYAITPSEIRLQVQCHPYHNIDEVRSFWASVVNVPEERIQILVIKKRGLTKRFRKNFAGICQLRLPNVERRREIMAVANQIELWYNNDTRKCSLP